MRLTFICKIPNENAQQNTGGMSRILTMDKYLNFVEEIFYIDFKNRLILDKNNKKTIKLTLTEVVKIIRISDFIYIHAFANMTRFLPFKYLTNAKIIFDAHGVASVEEKVKKNYIKYYILSLLETISLNSPDLIISVTKSMESYFITKSKSIKKMLVLPIVNKIDLNEINSETVNNISLINKKSNEHMVVYSGGIQVWQNINLMVELANKNRNKKLKFLFLSKEKEFIENKINKSMLNKTVFVFSTTREQIGYYYKLSNFGFLLREENLVNKVAFPTKLFEYIDFEIVPIVLNKKIGDFESLGIEGVLFKDLEAIDNDLVKKMKENNTLIKVELNKEFECNKEYLINFIKGNV